jgi:hypothetical protein
LLLTPSQFSATSHGPLAGRQVNVFGCLASEGQVALVPVQFSATSHTPPDARHTTVFGLYVCGHTLEVPVQ